MLVQSLFGSHDQDVSMHESTLASYPDFLLHNVDEYMASLIQEVSDRPHVLKNGEISDL